MYIVLVNGNVMETFEYVGSAGSYASLWQQQHKEDLVQIVKLIQTL